MATLRRAHLPQFKVCRYFRSVSQNRALTGIPKCFHSFISGIRCYYSCFELRGTPPFPVRQRVIAEWISIFRPVETFPNYVGYVRKACFFLEQPLTWDTPAATNIIASLKLEDKGKFAFPNFIRSSVIAKIIVHESRGGFSPD